MDRSAEESPREVSNDNQGLSDLISKASRGDSQALSDYLNHTDVERKVRRIATAVLALYGSRGVYENAEDLKQEVYLKVLSNIKGIRDFRSDTEFFGWIHSVARNIYLNSLRKSVLERKSVGEDELFELFQTERTGSESQYHEPALKGLLDKLDPEEGKILELSTQGYTPRQIADKLGISLRTAYRLVSQVQKGILEEVDELTTNMKKSQIEIEQEKALTRHIINELIA